MNTGNPWLNLPAESPYILSEDEAIIESSKNFSNLRLETLPEPYIGNLDTAQVIFLALNPGFEQADIDVNMKSELFTSMRRHNYTQDKFSSFYYFAGGLEFTGGYRWWSKRLKPLLKDINDEKLFAQKIMCIEYFPYHSVKYKHISKILPSQKYSFELVRQAIRNNKLIIIMRGKKFWLEAVPELNNYTFIMTNSVQNPTISPKNVGQRSYDKIKGAIIN